MSELTERNCRICLLYCELQNLIKLLEVCELYKKSYQFLLEECTSYKVSDKLPDFLLRSTFVDNSVYLGIRPNFKLYTPIGILPGS